MSNLYVDCEFIEDGRTIDLISIAVVAEDGREFYRLNYDCDFDAANDWVKVNVIPKLPEKPPTWARGGDRSNWRNHSQIGVELLEFVGDDKEPVFIGDFASYDWVALCQLYGPMVNLPSGWPMFIRDVQQYWKHLGVGKFSVGGGYEHDALSDARECKARWEYLEAYEHGKQMVKP